MSNLIDKGVFGDGGMLDTVPKTYGMACLYMAYV